MGAGPCSGHQWSRRHSVTLVGEWTNSRFVGWGSMCQSVWEMDKWQVSGTGVLPEKHPLTTYLNGETPYAIALKWDFCALLWSMVELRLHLHLVILQTLLSKATYNWGIHQS